MSNTETIVGIIAEMRGLVKPGETLNHTYELLNGLADRIEVALKREHGNAQKMREALDKLLFGEYKDECEVTLIAGAALAAPARPCDTMGWRDAWAMWRTEVKPQKPETYVEAYEGTAAFMDWFTTPMKGGAKCQEAITR